MMTQEGHTHASFRARIMHIADEFEYVEAQLGRSQAEISLLREALKSYDCPVPSHIGYNDKYASDKSGVVSGTTLPSSPCKSPIQIPLGANVDEPPGRGEVGEATTPALRRITRSSMVKRNSRTSFESEADVSRPGASSGSHAPARNSMPSYDFQSVRSRQFSDVDKVDKAGDNESVRIHLPSDWPRCLELRSQLDKDVILEMQSLQNNRDHWLATTKLSSRGLGTGGPDVASHLILEPTSSFLVFFDLIKLVALLYDLIFTPFSLAWELPVTGSEQAVAFVLIGIWWLDIGVGFRTAFISFGHLEKHPYAIAVNYLRRGFALDFSLVLIDVVSVIIVHAVSGHADERSIASGLRTVRMARIARVLKLLRLPTLQSLRGHVLEGLDSSQDFQLAFSFFRLILFIFWFNHTLSCMWYFISWAAHSDTGSRWVDVPNGGADAATYQDLPKTYQYMTALHWSLTQMTPASMQVNSLNSVEKAFNIAALVCGTFLFTFNMSMLSAKLTQRMISTKKLAQQSKQLDRFLLQGCVGRSLTMRVKMQVRERLNGHKVLVSWDDVEPSLSLIATSLQQELQVELCRPHLLRHDFFLFCHRVDEKCAESLGCVACTQAVLPAGDSLFMTGTVSETTYLILEGAVTYLQTNRKREEEESAELVGAMEWMCEPAVWTQWLHVGRADVHAACMILKLDTMKCLNVLTQNPAIWDVASQYGWHFHRLLVEDEWPSDLNHPPDFCEVLQAMESDTRLFVGLFALNIMRKTRKTDGIFNQLLMKYQHLDELEKGLRAGHNTLSLSATDEIVRVSHVVVASVQRESDKAYWVQLGKCTGGLVSADARLPGFPVSPGESPQTILEHLLGGKLMPIAHAVDIRNVEKASEVRKSRHFGILTYYMQTVHHCVFHGASKLRRPCQKMLLLRQRTSCLPVTTEIYAYEHSSTVYYFAWLGKELLSRLKDANELRNVEHSLQDLVQDGDSESEDGDRNTSASSVRASDRVRTADVLDLLSVSHMDSGGDFAPQLSDVLQPRKKYYEFRL